MSTKQYTFIVFIIVFSILGAFYSGFIIKSKLSIDDTEGQKPSNLMPYFSDELIMITKDQPHYTLIATASRYTKDNINYSQKHKIYYYDGTTWKYDTSTTKSDSIEIIDSTTIPKWKITDDPSRVLKQSVSGEISIDKKSISFDIPLILNEMGVRSSDNYTIFRSEADGKLTINGVTYDSNILYTRTYSYSASIGEIVLTEKPIGITTNWGAFWDQYGNFYNFDETIIAPDGIDPYKSHSISIFKDSEERIQKSFKLNVYKTEESKYLVEIGDKQNKILNLTLINSTERNPGVMRINNKVGQIEGEVKLESGRSVKGFGVFEYIYQ